MRSPTCPRATGDWTITTTRIPRHATAPTAGAAVFSHRLISPPLESPELPRAFDQEATDTTQLLGLMIAKRALLDAGYGEDRQFDRQRVSVILGISGTLELVIPLGARLGEPIWRRALEESGIRGKIADSVVERIASSYVGWQENSFPGLLGNVAAGRIAQPPRQGCGTNCVVDAACASSLGAVDMALLELSAGRCDLAVTGGIDTFNDIFVYMCFSKTPALSESGEARPFDAAADGTILQRGAGDAGAQAVWTTPGATAIAYTQSSARSAPRATARDRRFMR